MKELFVLKLWMIMEKFKFSIKTTKNKTIIDECEATPYVPIAELTANYEKLIAEEKLNCFKRKKKQSKRNKN